MLQLADDHAPFISRFLSTFKPTQVLGFGTYGCVFEAEQSVEDFFKWEKAVKRMPLRGSKNEVMKAFEEIKALNSFDHKGIVKFEGAWLEKPPPGWQRGADDELFRELKFHESIPFSQRDFYQFQYRDDSSFLYIQTEVCKYSLHYWLSMSKTRDLKRMLNWFKQIVSAVEYIHSKGKTHRDLKPHNILFADENRLKICDLGVVADAVIADPVANEDTDTALTDRIRTADSGTRMYMAPEQKWGEHYSCKVDIRPWTDPDRALCRPRRILGEGGYGIVFEAVNTLDQNTYAVKRISVPTSNAGRYFKGVVSTASLRHKGIVNYHNSWNETAPELAGIAPEGWQLCKEITLRDFLQTTADRDLSQAILWFKQILSAISYIHLKGFIHKNLKTKCMLFDSNDRMKIGNVYHAVPRTFKNGEEVDDERGDIGTPKYMAPEQASIISVYSSKVDIFTLGLILTEMCVDIREDAYKVFDDFRWGKPNNVLDHLPEVAQFVAWFTNVDSKKRPTCDEILAHDFLS